jgi:hypothetical protein
MSGRGGGATLRHVKTGYAVKWREPDGREYLGLLTLTPAVLRLEGRGSEGRIVERQLARDRLRDVRIGRTTADRLDGRPTLVVEHPDGTYHVAGAVTSTGILRELVGRLCELRSHPLGAAEAQFAGA